MGRTLTTGRRVGRLSKTGLRASGEPAKKVVGALNTSHSLVRSDRIACPSHDGVTKAVKLIARERFGKNIGKLLLRRNMLNGNKALFHMVPEVKHSYRNVFGAWTNFDNVRKMGIHAKIQNGPIKEQ